MTARKPDHSLSTAKKRSATTQSSRRAGKPIEAAIAEFLLDRESQNHSPKTLKWHRTALAHLAAFLEEHYQVTHLSMLETVHLRAWMVFLEKEPGAKGKPRVARTCRWYAQSMHAFCHWLYDERYIEENPAARVKLPKLEKPLIRIIEFEEFEALLDACAPPQETGLIADRNTARNRAILWLLWDTGIRLGELCGLRLENFDRRQGTIIVFGKGRKERRVALGKNALRALLYYLDHWRQAANELEEIGIADENHLFLAETGQAPQETCQSYRSSHQPSHFPPYLRSALPHARWRHLQSTRDSRSRGYQYSEELHASERYEYTNAEAQVQPR